MPDSPASASEEFRAPVSPPPTAKGASGNFLDAAILPWAALAAYWPAIRGGLLWDDGMHLTRQPLRSLHGLWNIWFRLGATAQYYPVLHSAFWAEYHLWGLATVGYHVMNVLLHGLAAYLVMRIVRSLELPGAWLAAFVFALHPVCVESVAWMSEQKSTLSGVFYLASALSYLSFDQSRRRREYYLALAFFVLALLSKSVTATLPAVLLVIFWWRRGRLDWRRDIRPLSGWLVLGACSGAFTAWVEKAYVHAQGTEYKLTALQHIVLAGRVVWFYAGKVIWPVNLSFNYPRWNLDPTQPWQYLYTAGLLALAGVLAVAARRTRGPLAVLAIFVGTLTPVLGFLSVYPFRYSFVADHFQYLASLAIIVPVCALLARAAQRLALPQQAQLALAGALVLLLGGLTWRQAHQYTDAETLYRATLYRNPDSFLAQTNLCGTLIQASHRLADARPICEAAVRTRPDQAENHLNMGLVEVQTPGRLSEAIDEIREAVRIRPSYGLAHYALGNSLAMEGRFTEAVPEFEASLRNIPDYAEGYVGLGKALAALPERQPDALTAFDHALRMQPCNVDALYNKGATLSQLPGRSADAREALESALDCQPDYAPAQLKLDQLRSR